MKKIMRAGRSKNVKWKLGAHKPNRTSWRSLREDKAIEYCKGQFGSRRSSKMAHRKLRLRIGAGKQSKSRAYAPAQGSSGEPAKAAKYFSKAQKTIARLAATLPARARLNMQLVEVARVAQRLKKNEIWRREFEKLATARAGSAKYLAVVRYFLPGTPPTVHRHAQFIERCMKEAWSRDEMNTQLNKSGPTALSNPRRKSP